MIVIINGSLGVGKSSVSDALLWKLDQAVLLDGDHLGNVNPFEIYDPRRIAHLYATIQLLVNFHHEHGYQNFVINYVFESSQSMQELVDLLAGIHQPIRELQDIQRAAHSRGFIGQEIDTTEQSADQVAETIRHKMEEAS